MSARNRHLADLASEKLCQIFHLVHASECLKEWQLCTGRASDLRCLSRLPIQIQLCVVEKRNVQRTVLDYFEIWKNT